MKNYNDTNFITGMRFYAVFLVFLAHSIGTGIFSEYPILMPLYHLGKYGVDMFFVISGFTIYFQLSNKRLSLIDFYYIRLSRISSAYWPILVFLIIYYWLFEGAALTGWFNHFGYSLTFKNIIAHFLFLGWGLPQYANNIIGVEWSLNIEVFYYLLFGVLFFYLQVNKLNKISSLLVIFFMFSVFISIYREQLKIPSEYFLWLPFKYCYLFALGGVSFYIRDIITNKYNIRIQKIFSDLSIILALITFILLYKYDLYTRSSFLVSFIFSIICSILLVFVNNTSKFAFVFTCSSIVFLGTSSFSFYLVHYPISNFLNLIDINVSSELKFLLNFSLSSIVAYLWYLIFEVRLYNRLKRKWFEKH